MVLVKYLYIAIPFYLIGQYFFEDANNLLSLLWAFVFYAVIVKSRAIEFFSFRRLKDEAQVNLLGIFSAIIISLLQFNLFTEDVLTKSELIANWITTACFIIYLRFF